VDYGQIMAKPIMSDVGPGRNRDCSAAAGLRILELI
jgi:hypothetical protein